MRFCSCFNWFRHPYGKKLTHFKELAVSFGQAEAWWPYVWPCMQKWHHNLGSRWSLLLIWISDVLFSSTGLFVRRCRRQCLLPGILCEGSCRDHRLFWGIYWRTFEFHGQHKRGPITSTTSQWRCLSELPHKLWCHSSHGFGVDVPATNSLWNTLWYSRPYSAGWWCLAWQRVWHQIIHCVKRVQAARPCIHTGQDTTFCKRRAWNLCHCKCLHSCWTCYWKS